MMTNTDSKNNELDAQPRMRTPQAAVYVGLSKRTLEKWRRSRTGPAFHRLGRAVVYDRRDLDEFLDRNRQS
jgi:excisionase family DNA binding protein